jgi:hypothetical protein
VSGQPVLGVVFGVVVALNLAILYVYYSTPT